MPIIHADADNSRIKNIENCHGITIFYDKYYKTESTEGSIARHWNTEGLFPHFFQLLLISRCLELHAISNSKLSRKPFHQVQENKKNCK